MTLGDSHWPVTMETKGHCDTGTGSSPRILIFRQYHRQSRVVC